MFGNHYAIARPKNIHNHKRFASTRSTSTKVARRYNLPRTANPNSNRRCAALKTDFP